MICPETYFITARQLQELENNGGYRAYEYTIRQKLEDTQ